MIVCSCNVISDRDVRASLDSRGERGSVGKVFRHIGCEAKCGRCVRNIVAILEQHSGRGLDECGRTGDCGPCGSDDRAA